MEGKGTVRVVSLTMDLEQEANRRYSTLTDETTPPHGQALLLRLAEEEHNHYLVLSRLVGD